jgi:hypothetical protein
MRHLFMQDSESPRTFGKLFTLAVGVLIALVISDWLIGRVLPYITAEPPFILRFENVPGIEALWRFSEANLKPIVFTGSSQVYAGISPHVFNDHIKSITGQTVQSVNVSLFGSVVTIERDFIRNLILPNHPQIVLYGIEMRALKSEGFSEDYIVVSDFKNKPLGYALSRESFLERGLLLWLLQHSNLVQYRDNLRGWLTGARKINQGVYSSSVDDLGYAPFPNTSSQNPDNIQTQFIPFHRDDLADQMMVDIETSCKQSGVQCILLNMPIHQIAYQYISPQEEAQYQQILKDADLPIWDFNTANCRALLGDENFYNVNHLNSNGAIVFSKMIAEVYASAFFNIPVSGNATCAAF